MGIGAITWYPTGKVLAGLNQAYQEYYRDAHGETLPLGVNTSVLRMAFVADTDEKAQEIGRHFMWTEANRMKGPREHNDPPGYQSREAVRVKAQRPTGNVEGAGGLGVGMTYEQLQSVNNIIVGNPETVTRKLTQVIERLHPGYLQRSHRMGVVGRSGFPQRREQGNRQHTPERSDRTF